MRYFILGKDVKAALKNNKPVVALESTVITHGMPYPDNLAIALRIEKEVRDNKATPATIAILDGILHVGLNVKQLEKLATTVSPAKLSRADISSAVLRAETGGTTVAATMIIAALAGIPIFSTGGIGGVHRGAEQSFDVSADLQELAKTPVTVVAAGAKAILDLPKTFELLETLGVPVIAYRQNELPAFWSRFSGIKASIRLDSPEEIARSHKIRAQLGIQGGQLVANPIPRKDEIPQNQLEPLIKKAIKDAQIQKIKEKKVTPYLLGKILEFTNGKSLTANTALLINNARLSAKIAQFL